PARVWQFRHRRMNGGNAARIDDRGRKVRLREVAVIMRFFFAAHRKRPAGGGVEEPRFLDDAAALLQDADLALDFVLERLLQEPERVQILDFRLGSEWR